MTGDCPHCDGGPVTQDGHLTDPRTGFEVARYRCEACGSACPAPARR